MLWLALLFLLSHPGHKFHHIGMRPERLERVKISPQHFLLRYKAMDSIVAIAAQGDRHLHLLARKPLLKPLVLVASSRNEVMSRGPCLHLTKTKLTSAGQWDSPHRGVRNNQATIESGVRAMRWDIASGIEGVGLWG